MNAKVVKIEKWKWKMKGWTNAKKCFAGGRRKKWKKLTIRNKEMGMNKKVRVWKIEVEKEYGKDKKTFFVFAHENVGKQQKDVTQRVWCFNLWN